MKTSTIIKIAVGIGAIGAIGYFAINSGRSIKQIILSKQWYHPDGSNVNSYMDVKEDGTVLHIGNSAWVGTFDGKNKINWINTVSGETITWSAR